MINPPPQNSYFYSSSVDTSPKIEHVAIQEPDMKSIPQFQRLSIHQRLDMIERSMMNASFLFDQMDQQRQATGLPALPRVFIAPENFFAKPIPVGSLNATHTLFGASRNYSVGPAEEKQLDVEEKRGVVSGLLAVS